MNKNKLARQHGFYTWAEFLKAAESAKSLKQELADEKRRHEPLVRAAETANQATAAAELAKKTVAATYRDLSVQWAERADSAQKQAEAFRIVAREWRKRADELDPEFSDDRVKQTMGVVLSPADPFRLGTLAIGGSQ